MVDLKYFDLLKMNKKERRKFNVWYKGKCKAKYVFCKEIYYYCKSDVDILMKGFIIFADLIVFSSRSFTILCNKHANNCKCSTESV